MPTLSLSFTGTTDVIAAISGRSIVIEHITLSVEAGASESVIFGSGASNLLSGSMQINTTRPKLETAYHPNGVMETQPGETFRITPSGANQKEGFVKYHYR